MEKTNTAETNHGGQDKGRTTKYIAQATKATKAKQKNQHSTFIRDRDQTESRYTKGYTLSEVL